MPIFSPFDLPEGIILLITDGLAAPADFVLHRCLAAHLKDHKRARTVILSVSEGIARWKAIASKSNVNLQQHLDSGAVRYVDVLAEAHPCPHFSESGSDPDTKNLYEDRKTNVEKSSGLKAVLDRVRSLLEVEKDVVNGETVVGVGMGTELPPGPVMVILDDITMLEWIGFPLLEVARFVRALRALCIKANATLLVRHHVVTPGEPDDMFRRLLQICTYHLEVRSLSSGRSGNVSGEVSLHPGFSAPQKTIKLVPRSAALQYRLTDGGPDFFAKGTSEVVL